MTEYNKCHVLGLGVGIGAIFAVYIFLLGISAWLFSWGGGLVNAMSSLYIGYKATFIGSIIGLIWGFIDGFIFGVVLAWIYNMFVK